MTKHYVKFGMIDGSDFYITGVTRNVNTFTDGVSDRVLLSGTAVKSNASLEPKKAQDLAGMFSEAELIKDGEEDE